MEFVSMTHLENDEADNICNNNELSICDSNRCAALWCEFGDIPMNPETECIESEWNGFPVGTHREEIWHWFEEAFDVSVAEDLMGL